MCMKVFVTNSSDEDFRVHVTQFADTLGDFSVHMRVSLPTTTNKQTEDDLKSHLCDKSPTPKKLVQLKSLCLGTRCNYHW